MSQTKVSRVGEFCWVETATKDLQATATFYNQLFGWGRTDMDMPDGAYAFLGTEEMTAAGMFQLDQAMLDAGAGAHWMSYVEVENVEAAMAKAESLGGKVCMGPVPVSDFGRFSILSDPTGAAFSVWQSVGEETGKPFAKNRPGALVWNELVTDDVPKAQEFYTKMFGWDSKAEPLEDGPNYVEFSLNGEPVGGLTPLPESWPKQARWLVYFAVTDCEASTKKVQELGGQIMCDTQTLPDVGTFTVVADSAGAVFALIQMPEA